MLIRMKLFYKGIEMKNVVIVSGTRTPIGGYGGALRDVPVHKFTSVVLNEAVKKAYLGI